MSRPETRMSDPLLRRFDGFVRDFAAPFVAGGPMRIGRPVGGRELRFFTGGVAVAPEATAAIIDARDQIAGEIAVHRPALPPIESDETAVRLLAAAHNLLVLWHPALSAGLVARRARKRIREFTTRLVQSIPPARDAREAIAMHTVLWNLPRIRRVDRTVRFWAGTRRFVGQTPPRRLTIWPRLRRVSVEEDERSWMAEPAPAGNGVAGDDPLVQALLARSPITDLSNARAGFRATEALLPLATPGLSRYVIDRLLRRGLQTPGLGAALAAAFFEAIQSPGCPPAVVGLYGTLLVRMMEAMVYAGGPAALGALVDTARPLLGAVALLIEREERGDLPALGIDVARLGADRDPKVADVGRALGSLVVPGTIEELLGEADAEAARLALSRRLAE